MADPAVANDPQAVRDAMRDILERDEFQRAERQWWSPILDFIQDPIGTIVGWVDWLLSQWPSGTAGLAIAWVVAAVVAIAVVVFVVHLSRSVTNDAGAPIAFAPLTGTKSRAELLYDAEQFERNQQWAEAIRSRYGSLIVELSEAGLVKGRPGRTTGEYVREFADAAPAAAPFFQDATSIFEWVWYGDGEPQEADVQRFRDLANVVSKVPA